MPRNTRANVELVLNIVTAMAIVVVASVLVKRHFLTETRENAQQQARVNVGSKLTIPNVDWKQNHKTLVFFLKKDCPYCNSSASLYRQLIAEAAKRDVKWLAILPDSLEEGHKYIQSLNLPIENVHTGSFAAFKIPGAPSVLFVDNQGTVRSVWIGAEPGRDQQMHNELVALFDES